MKSVMVGCRGLAVSALIALVGYGCNGSGEQTLCEPGAERDCDCPGGISTCEPDGMEWGDCECPCVPDCDGRQCGPDGCGGECGTCEDPPADECADDFSLRTFDEIGACSDGGCEYTGHVGRCEFGCLEAECLPDPCDALACDSPPGPCYSAAGACIREPEPHCEYEPLEDGTACPDGSACNGEETCRAGECLAGEPPDCSPLDDDCNQGACDEQAGGCLALPLEDGTSCGDGLFCNGQETCQAGQCAPGTPLDCSHLDAFCAVGDCSEGLRRCVARPQNTGSSCSDGLVCNGDEVCRSGECVSSGPLECQQPENPCQQARCDEAAGGCVVEDVPDDTPCDDGDDCTLGDACQVGNCISGAVAPNGTACDDGDPCTIDDACTDGSCAPGEEICSDMVVVLMYLDGDNNLDSYLTADWHEMEAAQVEDFPWLRVFVLIDHYGSNDSHLYEVQNGHSQELDGPNLGLTVDGAEELNMADGDTVLHFIQDVKAIAGTPANYYLVISDHGDGWRRTRSARPAGGMLFRGTCSDDHGAPPGDVIYTQELRQAVSGQDLQLIAFDACLEGMAEVAYELRDHALVMVASQELEPGDGWQFTDLLSQYGQSGSPSPHLFGQIAVDTYIDSYPDDGWYDDLTLAAFDLTIMDVLAVAADAVAGQLTSMESGPWNSTCGDMDWYGCIWMWCEDYTDLTHLTERARYHDTRDNDAVYDMLLSVLDEVIIYDRHRSDHPNAHGMNVYFPCQTSVNGAYSAANILWAADTGWDEMLLAH